jgi:hypothetical protein
VLGVLALVACRGGSTEPRTEGAAVLPPLGPGVVSLEAWLDGEGVDDVSRASAGALYGHDPSIVVLGPPGAGPRDDGVIVVAESTPPAPILTPTYFTEDSDEVAVSPGAPCGGSVLGTAVPGGAVTIASRGEGRPALEAVAAAVSLDGPEVVVGPIDGFDEIGRLPAGWLHAVDASTATLGDGDDGSIVLVRRVDPAGAAAIDALLCDDPGRTMDVPPTVGVGDLGSYRRRTLDLGDGATAEVGVIANTAAVALHGDRVAVYVPLSGRARFADAELAAFLRDAVAVPDEGFDRRAGAIDTRLGDAALAAAVAGLPDGNAVTADGTTGGDRWVLVARFEPRLPGDLLCLTVVRTASGYQPPDPFLSGSCILDQPGDDGLRATYSFGIPMFGIAEVDAGAATIEVLGPAGAVEATLFDDVRGRRYAAFVVPGEPLGYGGSVSGYSMQFADGSTVAVSVRDAAGVELHHEVIGAF